VHPEEVTQANEGLDCLNIRRWFGILDSLQLILARFNPLQRKSESQV
jgi:hypothetical protein